MDGAGDDRRYREKRDPEADYPRPARKRQDLWRVGHQLVKGRFVPEPCDASRSQLVFAHDRYAVQDPRSRPIRVNQKSPPRGRARAGRENQLPALRSR